MYLIGADVRFNRLNIKDNTMTRTFFIFSFMLFASMSTAQNHESQYIFTDVLPTAVPAQFIKNIPAKHYRLMQLDLTQLHAELEQASPDTQSARAIRIALPSPDGTTKWYRVIENNTLHPTLRAKFPTIRTYDAYGETDPTEFVKLDLTQLGFHAMILKPGDSPVFIDPVQKETTLYYMVYKKKDYIAKHHLKCDVNNQSRLITAPAHSKSFANFNSCQLKQYRLAMAATAEYTSYFGGVNQALGAQATTVNRVNGVYETDMAITFQIIADNNLIIYTDPNTQPYTHGDPERMINENQVAITQVIGASNYDIGHVVDTAGSGLATLGCVCNDAEKAQGVTGKTNPVGDPFDIDYVAHEIGHQFGANHVQNNDCNRYDPTAVEPGSGSTIMGYAGICAPNIQNNSDAYFNGISLQEMGTFVSSPLHTCPVKTAIAGAPIVNRTNGGVVIPAQTPFALTAAATPSSGNGLLTYTWEQMDNQISPQPPESNALGGPNFRSLPPTTTGTRFFPNLIDLSNGGPFTWEVIPSVSRTMKFRTSVRSNTPGGSCNAYKDTKITTVAYAGPFVVTSPTEQGISWTGLSSQLVTWDVANTNTSPVNAAAVNIFLSADGGATFPYPVSFSVTNNGMRQICVPNVTTNTARIMVQASNGTFFNISRNNFSIAAAPLRAPVLTAATRDPMHPQNAFILYADCLPLANAAYHVNGIAGATVRLDDTNHRLIVENINTPKKIRDVTITLTDENNVSKLSNPITIPSIL